MSTPSSRHAPLHRTLHHPFTAPSTTPSPPPPPRLPPPHPPPPPSLLEQLCINFANEKLQQFFLATVFESEEQQYKDEGVPWLAIPYADNKAVIALIENGVDGIYTQLDSACKGPSPSGRAFCAGLHQSHGKDPKSKTFGAP